MDLYKKRTRWTVSWPVQGVVCFRSQATELVLSDVYWLWIFETLSQVCAHEQRLPFIAAVNNGFNDASRLVETIPVTEFLLELLRKVQPASAPSFERLIPTPGSIVPTPERILDEFIGLVGEAVLSGAIEMEIE